MHRSLRHAVRSCLRNRLSSLAIVSSLALGIGVTTAVFSAMHVVLWRPLAVESPADLVEITVQRTDAANPRRGPWSLSEALRAETTLLDGVVTHSADGVTLTIAGQAERVVAEVVSGDYFSVLGVGAAAGRLYSPEVQRGEWRPEVVLSYSYWKSRFNLDPGAIGQAIGVDGYPFTVVGVSEPSFEGIVVGAAYQIRLPFLETDGLNTSLSIVRPPPLVSVLGRLAPGATRESLRSAGQALLEGIAGGDARWQGARVRVGSAERGVQGVRPRLEQPLVSLAFVATLLLLAACLNVANVQLGRAARRQGETALRVALGAQWRALASPLIAEAALLSVLGVLFGLVIASWAASLLTGLVPASHVPMALSIQPGERALAFASTVGLVAGVLFTVVPTVGLTRLDLSRALARRAGSAASGPGSTDLGRMTVVFQVGVSTVLLVLAGLFVRTSWNLNAVDPGFLTDRVVQFSMKHVRSQYTTDEIRLFYEQLIEQVSALQGAECAGLAEAGPLSGRFGGRRASSRGGERSVEVKLERLSAGFLNCLEIAVVAGRGFKKGDREGTRPVAVVDTETARALYPGASPLGRTLRVHGQSSDADYEIVGVVESSRVGSLRTGPDRVVYTSLLQGPVARMPTLYVRSDETVSIVPQVRDVVSNLDPRLPLFDVKTLRRRLEESVAVERLTAGLSSVLGGLGALLVGVGVFGVMALAVERRTHEIGVRMAVGADSCHVLRAVIRQALELCGMGLLVGVPAAFGAGRYAASQLFGVEPDDPATLGVVVLGIGIVALGAALVPGLTAARVDPVLSLRSH